MILAESTAIAASPQSVFAFFEDMEANYLRWHPDHIAFRWVKGRGLAVGNVFAFEERIGGKLLRKQVRLVEVVPDRLIAFEPTQWLMRLFLPRISFRIEARPDGTLVTQTIPIRTGPIGAWLNRREFDAVRRHMREEGINLGRLLAGA